MTAEHRRELRVVLEHVAAQDRWTVGTSPEIQRLGEVLWSHRREAAAVGLPDEVRQRHRAELTATLTSAHIDRSTLDGTPFHGFADGRYRWNTTLNRADDWLPRHPIPTGLPGAGTAVDLNHARAEADAGHAAGVGLNPPVSGSTAAEPAQAATYRPQHHSTQGIART